MGQCDEIWAIRWAGRSDGGWGDHYIVSAEVNGHGPLYISDYDK